MEETPTEQTAAELPRVLQLLWGIEGPARPGPKPTLHISDIGAAAIRIADTAGLGAVSMAKVAAEVGFTTMSLYRYVDSKDELYTVMIDEAFGVPEPIASDGWRPGITQWATMVRDAIYRHPWILQVPLFEPPLSPKQLQWMEAGLRVFDGTPLKASDRLSSMVLVNIYVRGATQLTADMFVSSDRTKEENDQLYLRRLLMLATPDRLPMIAATMADFSDEGDEFQFGLDAVLDGIQALIDRSAARA
ncbi:TetR/AcrR family transcriptional regulator [Kribbella qitaiheensis]|uniref:TetR/AcrR family transcriptional regulator n=1 Tax=Kribbella qitaiheensis TaxID=1544730 RepID=A0A7G6WXY0_9ACTN|nr:TetR/AcrR family transcriptional regulator [Kribbella qitaiheensis]QNE18845.1 TetR/AcrR family transcriptional regulator [Kribbella qitaiheensis]